MLHSRAVPEHPSPGERPHSGEAQEHQPDWGSLLAPHLPPWEGDRPLRAAAERGLHLCQQCWPGAQGLSQVQHIVTSSSCRESFLSLSNLLPGISSLLRGARLASSDCHGSAEAFPLGHRHSLTLLNWRSRSALRNRSSSLLELGRPPCRAPAEAEPFLAADEVEPFAAAAPPVSIRWQTKEGEQQDSRWQQGWLYIPWSSM